MKLKEYICFYYNNCQARFAKHIGVAPAQITQWLKKDFIVIGGYLYLKKRQLKKKEKELTCNDIKNRY